MASCYLDLLHSVITLEFLNSVDIRKLTNAEDEKEGFLTFPLMNKDRQLFMSLMRSLGFLLMVTQGWKINILESMIQLTFGKL